MSWKDILKISPHEEAVAKDKEDVNSENLERMAGAVTTTAPAHAKLFKPAYRTRKKRKDE